MASSPLLFNQVLPRDFVAATGPVICTKSILGRQIVLSKDPARVFGAAEFGN